MEPQLNSVCILQDILYYFLGYTVENNIIPRRLIRNTNSWEQLFLELGRHIPVIRSSEDAYTRNAALLAGACVCVFYAVNS